VRSDHQPAGSHAWRRPTDRAPGGTKGIAGRNVPLSDVKGSNSASTGVPGPGVGAFLRGRDMESSRDGPDCPCLRPAGYGRSLVAGQLESGHPQDGSRHQRGAGRNRRHRVLQNPDAWVRRPAAKRRGRAAPRSEAEGQIPPSPSESMASFEGMQGSPEGRAFHAFFNSIPRG